VRKHNVQAAFLPRNYRSKEKLLKEILDLEGEPPSFVFLESVKDDIDKPRAREAAKARAEEVPASIRSQIQASDWYAEK
jgi:hypothetical protein